MYEYNINIETARINIINNYRTLEFVKKKPKLKFPSP